MSRHGYVDECDEQWSFIMWRGAVKSAKRGKRGQQFFKDMIAALDAMPVKELHACAVSGECVCAMGALGKWRGVDLSDQQHELDHPDGDHEGATERVGSALGVARALALETAYENDEGVWDRETPAQRWARMRSWAERNLTEKEPQP